MISAAEAQLQAALNAVETASAPFEKAAMLVEIAIGLQQRPRGPEDLDVAVTLYREALRWSQDEAPPAQARIRARLATALCAHPTGGREQLQEARGLLEQAQAELSAHGGAAEQAEADMNLGLVIQTLAGLGAAAMTDAIAAYQRALRVFTGPAYPAECAILHNNLATAYMAGGDADSAKLREALAVQAFRAGLAQVSLNDHPREYAMLQNNLGNALQHAASGHPLENRLRALEAYREALRVRTEHAAPMEYANTLANLGHCLASLPADLRPAGENGDAAACLRQAARLFAAHGAADKAALLGESLAALDG